MNSEGGESSAGLVDSRPVLIVTGLVQEARIAAGLGLKLGDPIVVNVLGRNIAATVANLRAVDWETLGINFVLVFSPNTFRGAPHADHAERTNGPADHGGPMPRGWAARPNFNSARPAARGPNWPGVA